MKIVVDGTPLCYPLTGIGQYTRSLLLALAEGNPDWQFEVLAPYRLKHVLSVPNIEFNESASNVLDEHRVGWRLYWFDVVLPRAIRKIEPNWFWAAAGLVPFAHRGSKVALTVYDQVPERFPRTMSWAARRYRRANQRTWLGRADLVLPISKFVSDECKALFNVQTDAVIYPGVDEIFLETPQLKPDATYFVVLGTVEPRKNLEVLADVLLKIHELGEWPNNLSVWLIGGKGWRDSRILEKLSKLEAMGVVRRLGYVPREELPNLLAGARALLMPSLYEGFGIPLVEAGALGCPIVCSNIPHFAEIVGESGILMHEPTFEDMMRTYRAMLASNQVLERQNLAKMNKFSWRSSATRLSELLQSMSGS